MNDELAIRALVARYCDAVNCYDAEAWAACWAEDGQWHFLGGVHRGRESIRSLWEEVMGQLDFALMLAGTAQVQVDGDTATGRWYTDEIVRTRGEDGRAIVGVYDDEYRRIDGHWYIASRRYHKLYEAPTPVGECFSPHPRGVRFT